MQYLQLLARALVASVWLASIGLSTILTAPARADPVDDPCELTVLLFCRLLPIEPELDGDLDLTKQLPLADPTAPHPGSLPPADICANGCG
jgi:hypothetical protein